MRARKCELCGNPVEESLEVHHIFPVSQGGTHVEDNLVVLCASCHKVIHACIDHQGISDPIREYYSEVLDKLEYLVETGINESE